MIFSCLHQDVQVVICVNAVFFIQLSLILCFSETVSEVPEEDQEDTEDEEEISDYSEDGKGWRSGRSQLENQPGEVLGKEDATPYLKTLVSY